MPDGEVGLLIGYGKRLSVGHGEVEGGQKVIDTDGGHGAADEPHAGRESAGYPEPDEKRSTQVIGTGPAAPREVGNRVGTEHRGVEVAGQSLGCCDLIGHLYALNSRELLRTCHQQKLVPDAKQVRHGAAARCRQALRAEFGCWQLPS